jgi:DNA gyrase/topoisomerase IV subunit A
MLAAFIAFREEVITGAPSSSWARRASAPILVGLAIAVANIDEVIR